MLQKSDMNRNPPVIQSVQSIIDAIDNAIASGNLRPLDELLEQNIDITNLYYDPEGDFDTSILEYAIQGIFRRGNKKRQADVVAFLIEKKNPDLTKATGSHESYQNLISNMRVNPTVARPVLLAHIVNDIELEESFGRLAEYMDWKLVQRCYRSLPKNRVADLDWYKMQRFERNGIYSKECHLAWAIAFLSKVNNGKMKNLAKWTIAYALRKLSQLNPQPFLEMARKERPRLRLLDMSMGELKF
jgi:hypothetical protein